jgi:hypothetical protein
VRHDSRDACGLRAPQRTVFTRRRARRGFGMLALAVAASGLFGCALQDSIDVAGGTTIVNSTDRSVDVYVDIPVEGEVFLATLGPNETTTYGSATECSPHALVARRSGLEVDRIGAGHLCPDGAWEIHDD